MKSRVVAYLRPFPWSRIGGDRPGRTSAERSVRTYCRENDLELTGFLLETDDRTTRSFEDRVHGREAMAQLRVGLTDGLIVQRLEHVFSSAADAVASLERWLDEGIDFHCIEFLDESPLHLGPNASSAGMEAFIRGLATLQRRIEYEQIQQRMLNRRARGSWTGRMPFGFRLVDGVLIEDPDRIDRIRQMKKEHRQGRSYRDIARTHDISIGTAHRLVKTDLRKLRRVGRSGETVSAEGGRQSGS